MKCRMPWAPLLLASILHARPALADVYTWVDKDGTVHFQEEPPDPDTHARRLALPEGSVDELPPAQNDLTKEEGSNRGPTRPQNSPTKTAPAVELFSTSWCPYCKKAREYFTRRGIAFTEYDIERDANALKRKMSLDGHKRVPTAIIGAKVIRGYMPFAYQAALDET